MVPRIDGVNQQPIGETLPAMSHESHLDPWSDALREAEARGLGHVGPSFESV